MKPRSLAHLLVYSFGLFTLVYFLQQSFFAGIGVTSTATLLFVLLIVSAVFAGISIRYMYVHEHEGMVTFGIISSFLAIVLILTRYNYFGLFLFVLYGFMAAARLFRIAQELDKKAHADREAAANARRSAATPPPELPI